jgi:predicted extracellular nuclease
MPAHRSFVLLLAFAMALGALVPLVVPPRTDAISADIVISEFRTRGTAGGNDEFIELHNRSGLAVDVSGWEVRGSNNAGVNSTRVAIPAGTTIDPGCFYLVANSGAYSGSAAADLTYGTGITDDGGIGIQTPGGALVDAVGMSAGSFYKEGTTLAPLTTNTNQGYERKPGGATGHSDTDDNATDFALLAPSNPQNSASPCLTVGGATSPTGAGAANPSGVVVGDTTLLTVAVTPGTNPTSSGLTVTADLTPIGGSATQPFFDDGTNGDATAADLTFSYAATVGAVEPGNKAITATITDAEARSGSATINLTVQGEPTEIWEIQGARHFSELEGQQVFRVEGIVTAVRSNGFWMTDPTPDSGSGSEATSNGIFVFRGSESKPAIGDHVEVDGEGDEFRPNPATNLTITQLRSFTPFALISSGNALPTTVIGVDRVPPDLVIDDDSTSSVEAAGAIFDPASDGIDFWESLEGMRLSVADAVAVGPRNNFGEIAVVSQLTNAGLRTPRGGILVRGLGASGDYRPGDFNPERLILDDVLAPTPSVNVGDEFATDPVGQLDYGFGNFKLLVTANPGAVDNGLQPEVTNDDGRRELSVATYNVENLSAINTAAEAAKVARLANQIVTNLRSPDIIAIEEIQDNNGTANDGTVAADQSWQRLIDAIVLAGGPRYEYRQIDPENNADGGAPGGNIRVGFLFLPSDDLAFIDRPGGDATTDTNVVRAPRGRGGDDDDDDDDQGGGNMCRAKAQLTLSPGRIIDASVGGSEAFFETRKSLAGEFCFRGETVFIVVNHLSSKGDDRPLFGHFQPPFRLTEFQSLTDGTEDGWRHAQAQAINDFVDEILAVDRRAHVIVLGDINDFDFSETVDILSGERVALNPGTFMPDADGSGQTAATGKKPILTSLFDQLAPEERYSYVFDGNSQVLDQILVSSSVLRERPAYDVVHVNAEFANQASDHDPSVMVVRLEGDDD